MTGDEYLVISPEKLARDARMAREWWQDLKDRTVAAAETVARTEDRVAATMDRLASQRPERAERLRAMSEAARQQAAYARQWAKDHSCGAAPGPPPGIRRPGAGEADCHDVHPEPPGR